MVMTYLQLASSYFLFSLLCCSSDDDISYFTYIEKPGWRQHCCTCSPAKTLPYFLLYYSTQVKRHDESVLIDPVDLMNNEIAVNQIIDCLVCVAGCLWR